MQPAYETYVPAPRVPRGHSEKTFSLPLYHISAIVFLTDFGAQAATFSSLEFRNIQLDGFWDKPEGFSESFYSNAFEPEMCLDRLADKIKIREKCNFIFFSPIDNYGSKNR